MKKYIVSCCFLIASMYVQGQSKWTLRKCIDYAIENNIEIKQQYLQVENSEINLNTSKNSRLPDLNANFGHTYSYNRVQNASTQKFEEGVGSITKMGLASSTPLFTGFRITNEIEANKFNLMAAMASLDKAKENLELQVTSLFLDALFKKEIVKVSIEQEDLTKSEIERTELLVNTGKVPLSQLYDIKAQLAKDELNTTVANNNLTLSLLNLSQALNFTDFNSFDIAEPRMVDVVGDNISSILPPDQVYKNAVVTRPHVKEALYKLESSRKNLNVARSGYMPTLSLDLGYENRFNHFYKEGYPNVSASDQLKDNYAYVFGLTLRVPIFNRYQVRNKMQAARLDIQNSQLTIDNVKLNLYNEIQQAYQSAVASQIKYASTEKAYEASLESFKYAQERYKIGKLTVFELNASQVKLFGSKSEQIQAKYEFLFRTKILDFYNGKKIDIR